MLAATLGLQCANTSDRNTVVLLAVAFHSSHRLAPLLSGRGLFPLPLHGRLLVGDPTLHLLKQTGLEHLLLERFERGLDLVVEDRHPQFQRPLREEVDRGRTGAERSTTFISMRRLVPWATAAATVGHPSCDSATVSPA